MGCKSYKASAPGSLMLFGEHAVLHGKQAVVAAINYYICVELTPRRDRSIHITSSEFPSQRIALNKFVITKPYNYALLAIKQYLKKIPHGFSLNIRSDFPATIGFGSSAAVTVATLGVLAIWLESNSLDLQQLYRQAVKVVRQAYGVGSGADVAASVFGGVIAYKMRPTTIQKLTASLPLVTIYSGHKTPTFEVIAKVEKEHTQFPTLFAHLYSAMDCCTEFAIKAIKAKNRVRLGKLMNIHQGLQDALGVNAPILEELIAALRAMPDVHGAKISGAGIGDCVIGLGKIPNNTFPQTRMQKKQGIKQYTAAVSKRGFIELTIETKRKYET